MQVRINTYADTESYSYKMTCYINGQEHEKGEKELDQVNTVNAKAIIAINKALSRMNQPAEIIISTNNNIVLSGINNGWLEEWRNNNWINKKGNEVANKELWQQYLKLSSKHQIQVIKEE